MHPNSSKKVRFYKLKFHTYDLIRCAIQWTVSKRKFAVSKLLGVCFEKYHINK